MEENVGMPPLQAERDEYTRQYQDLFSEEINTFLPDVKELRDAKDCSSN